ncbi:MAG TPA: peptidoglycan-binding domain-containing protein [Candidatus Acidoferrales bacterium]|nr:peptidoglycan-binding domain-containing protein [Candidatus Acidoferrales bacterium]
MIKRTLMFLLGAALAISAASVVSAAGRPGSAQTSSTAAKKKKVAAKSKKKAKTKGQTAPDPDRIREIQTALQKDGSYEGEPNGKWDSATMDAMRKYQDKNGLNPTGKIDAPSLNKLGLGSGTAGKGAPVPATTSSATPKAPTDPSEK